MRLWMGPRGRGKGAPEVGVTPTITVIRGVKYAGRDRGPAESGPRQGWAFDERGVWRARRRRDVGMYAQTTMPAGKTRKRRRSR